MSRTVYPKPFLKRMELQLGEEFEDFVKAHDDASPVSLRVNPIKAPNLFSSLEKVPWNDDGRYLDDRPEFVFDPLIHAGAYYVQEASSMLFANAIDFSKDLKILDICAAPGGKSTLLASMMSSDSLLISNELVGKRVNILYENLVKWGHQNVIVTNNRTTDFKILQNSFDVVLVDAPCSGEGMFRKNKNALRNWAVNNAFKCSIEQKNILDDVIHLPNNNGLLLYSTCTYSQEENEQIISWLYNKYSNFLQPLTIPIKEDWNVVKQEINHFDDTKQEVYKCYPHKLKGEGLFLAGFIYSNHKCRKLNYSASSFFKDISSSERLEVIKYLKHDEKLILKQFNERIYGVPSHYSQEFYLAAEQLKTLKAGVFIGAFNRKNKEFIPSHELVQSTILSKELPSLELDKKQAISYLKKEDIEYPIENLQKGWIVVKYKNVPLGWIKNTGNRLNNFYPKEWKIRKEFSAY